MWYLVGSREEIWGWRGEATWGWGLKEIVCRVGALASWNPAHFHPIPGGGTASTLTWAPHRWAGSARLCEVCLSPPTVMAFLYGRCSFVHFLLSEDRRSPPLDAFQPMYLDCSHR